MDKTIAQLKTQAVAATPVDLQQWISYCTFDVICSLSFGEDFGCLEHNRYHEWVGVQVYSLNAKVQLGASRFYRWLFRLLVRSMLASAQVAMAKHQARPPSSMRRLRKAFA